MQPAYKQKETAGARRCNLATCANEVQGDVLVGGADREGEKKGVCMQSLNDCHIDVHGARVQQNCTDQRCSQPYLTANLKILSSMR